MLRVKSAKALCLNPFGVREVSKPMELTMKNLFKSLNPFEVREVSKRVLPWLLVITIRFNPFEVREVSKLVGQSK